MNINLGEISALHVGIIAVVAAAAWKFSGEICSMLTAKYFKKLDADYVTVSDCLHQRMNCEALTSVKESLDEHKEDLLCLKTALRTILLHSDIPLEAKQQAMEKLG